MSYQTDPGINDCKLEENWIEITFQPDLDRFKMNDVDKDITALMSRRVVECGSILGQSVYLLN